MNPESRDCQNCRKEFTIEPEDFKFYEKMQVPPPTFCPQCRLIRKLTFRNQRNLFIRKDDASGKEIFSGIPQSAPLKVYDLDYWNSDNWDAMEFGRDYDFSRTFFEQFRELMHVVPFASKSVQFMVDSDYCDQASYMKDSYLCFDGGYLENCAYCIRINNGKDSLDITEGVNPELCYDSFSINKCHKVFFSVDCENSFDIWFSRDLNGCNNCFGCVGLRNKSFYVFNKPCSKEEYFKKLTGFNLSSRKSLNEFREKSHEFWEKSPVKYMHGTHNVDVMGDFIFNSKKTEKSYYVHEAENVKYSLYLFSDIKDSSDYVNWGYRASKMYECLTCGDQVNNLRFCWECWPSSRDIEYSMECRSSSDLFGCVGLKKKSYCILNKQYTKEEYLALREKIMKHMSKMPFIDKKGNTYKYGEFFPQELSPFGYNHTTAIDFFPLSKEKALEQGFVWQEPEAKEYKTTLDASLLPDTIGEVDDSVLKEILKCTQCEKAYRIILKEIDFLRKMSLPLPTKCQNCRYVDRIKFRNQPKLYKRQCQCASEKSDNGIYSNEAKHKHGANHCPNQFETSYSPDRPDIVYCEDCYLQEVV